MIFYSSNSIILSITNLFCNAFFVLVSSTTFSINFMEIIMQSSPEGSSLKNVSPGDSSIHDNFQLQSGM